MADDDVAALLETLMGLAAKKGQLRTRTGPRDTELRHARVCYNHLAGDLGVALFDCLQAQNILRMDGGRLLLTETGQGRLDALGVEVNTKSRAPLCRECLDWSERRSHLAGRLGRGILDHIYAQGWTKRVEGTRIVRFSRSGEAAFRDVFGV